MSENCQLIVPLLDVSYIERCSQEEPKMTSPVCNDQIVDHEPGEHLSLFGQQSLLDGSVLNDKQAINYLGDFDPQLSVMDLNISLNIKELKKLFKLINKFLRYILLGKNDLSCKLVVLLRELKIL